MTCLYTLIYEIAAGKYSYQTQHFDLMIPNKRLSSFTFTDATDYFFTDQIYKTKCLFIMLTYLEFFLKTCYVHLIISLLLVCLFTIIIYPKDAFKNIFKCIASKMNQQCTSSVIPKINNSEVFARVIL